MPISLGTVDCMEKLTHYTRPKSRRPGGRAATYPWTEWTSGSWYRVHKGEDFTCLAKSFQNALHVRGHRLGLHVQSVIEDAETIVFRFTKKK